MIEKRKSHAIEEPQRLQYLATECFCSMGLHSLDGSIIVDTKSYISIHVLSLKKLILVMNELKEFFDMIKGIGETLE